MGQPSRLIEIRRAPAAHIPLLLAIGVRAVYTRTSTFLNVSLANCYFRQPAHQLVMLQAFSLNPRYSGPRLAIFFPPFRPSLTTAGSFFLGKIQRV
jgi:hypothetical protein